ncbi:uncharacterized protein LOC132748595 [Ruditapes philippinarum]|uniref:uncharacterized protein LOC132748595 n=1 Tax=Ruditapes philippinarum TaxID=129788 RepID=UPI00295A9078|nr:uncharacterized protein LOC132748595 [Ruditapes philippinarum]
MIMWMKRWLKILLLFVVVIILSMLVITQRLSSTINSYQTEQSGRSETRNVTAINSNQSKQKRTIQRTDTSKMKKQHKHIARKNYRKTCTVMRLKNRLRGKINGMTQCKKHPFLSRDCYSNFYKPYAIDIEGACRKPGSKQFCSITGTPDQWGVHCNITSCGKKVYLGTKTIDRINWKVYGNKEDLQKSIANLIQSSTTRFCFISCFTLHSHGFEPQILNLPPPPQRTNHKAKRKSRREQNHMNLNFIMIDSVSRVHFFRSLPRSVKALNEITTEHEDAMVLDFELVQGIRSRTFETLQALFSGYVNPYEVPFGINDLSKEKLNVAKWLLPLRELDFSSLWLEDMCPFTGWGLSRDLLVLNRTLDKQSFYMKFLDTCRKVGIDDIGNTLASCNILKSNGMSNPFNSKTICYNGRHHHSYLFSYLNMFQRTMNHRAKPFISYMVSSIAHELVGKRNQYIDSDLAEYLKFSSGMDNTLTIVFSDHGNAYRDSQSRNSNRVLEVFNPFLFMIIPKSVQSMLTANQMQALKINQNRLISLLDLHYTISYIIRLLQNENNSETSLDNDVNDFNNQFQCIWRGATHRNISVKNLQHHAKNNAEPLHL